jgi:D-alanyl-D-alanine carboxypeptidase/D-alanyl-D-alanine-endopeptidase (penicillin-binding protein 4)
MRSSSALGAAGLVLAFAAIALEAPASARPPDVAARTPAARPDTPTSATGSISAARLDGKLGALMRSAGSGSGAWVYDVDADRSVFGSHANRRRILASNTKLFTTAAALDRLGARRRLETRVWASGVDQDDADGVVDDVVDGNLYLVGDGDPLLSTRSMKELAAEVRRAGVKRVEGDLKIDASVFDGRRGTGVSGWSRYVGPLAGLVLDGGGGPNPATAAGKAFERLLKRRGVRVGGFSRGRLPDGLREERPLGSVRSAELGRLVAKTNKPSNNFFAEMLLKRLDAGDGAGGSTRGGARRVRRFARQLGSKVHARDGSGLSRADRASPHAVGKLLSGMLEHDGGNAFHSSLPVAGREGTVRHRMRGTAAQGRCRAKTGTLTGVSALSGYCDRGGKTVVFSILMNGVEVAGARRIQDRMVAAIARYG